MGIRLLIRSLIQNLVENALLHSQEAVAPTIRISMEQDPTSWTLRIRDNGEGISEQRMKEVFEPFVRASTTAKGHGLGLAVCNHVAKVHGGTIQVESQIGKGKHVLGRLS